MSVYVYMHYVYTYIYIYVHTYIYIYMYIHTYTYTYICARRGILHLSLVERLTLPEVFASGAWSWVPVPFLSPNCHNLAPSEIC